MRSYSYPVVLVAMAPLAVLAYGGAAEAATIRSCVKNATGAIRIVGTGINCASGEHLVTWSSVGPKGPPGPQGPAGPAGPPGISGFATVSGVTGVVPPGNLGAIDVPCPGGTTAVAGGYTVPYTATVLESHPRTDNSGIWTVVAAFPSVAGTITVSVECASVVKAAAVAAPAARVASRITSLSATTTR